MNTRLDSVSVRLDEKTNLRFVKFTCNGIIEYPTALNEKYTVADDPRYAWRDGSESIKLPVQYAYDRGRNLMLFYTETVLDSLGNALEEDPKTPKLLKTYIKNIDFPRPGKVDMTLDRGAVMYPPTSRTIPATIKLYLIGESLANDSNIITEPYQVKRWASFGATWIPTTTMVSRSESGAARGYLRDVVWSGINTSFKGEEVVSVVGWNDSNPTYGKYLEDIANGKIVSRELSPLLVSANGKTIYILQEVYVKHDFAKD